MENNFVHIPVFVRTQKPKTQLYSFDKSRQAFILDVCASPTKGDANAEIISFFKKVCKAQAEIISGRTNRRKIIRATKNDITHQLSLHELP